MDVKYTGPLWGNANGYYFCPKCLYVLADHKLDDSEIQHKNFCENCGMKLNWANRNTAGALIDKVGFVADHLSFRIKDIKRCDVKALDKAIEKYLLADDPAETQEAVQIIAKELSKDEQKTNN